MATDIEQLPNWHTVIATPIGEMTLVRDEHAITAAYFSEDRRPPGGVAPGSRSDAGFGEAVEQLGEYFDGQRRQFTLTLAAHSAGFLQRLWNLVEQIPYGRTCTYGELAMRLGHEVTAQRVIASMCGSRVCVLLPCHRVTGLREQLTAYVGGLQRKRFLLDLEYAHDGSRSHEFSEPHEISGRCGR